MFESSFAEAILTNIHNICPVRKQDKKKKKKKRYYVSYVSILGFLLRQILFNGQILGKNGRYNEGLLNFQGNGRPGKTRISNQYKHLRLPISCMQEIRLEIRTMADNGSVILCSYG